MATAQRDIEVQGLMAPEAPMEDGLAPGSLGTIPETVTWRNMVCKATHPIIAFFHLAFKGGAIALYIFGSFFGMDYVTVFVTSTLLLALDFWTVKNITGRLLVRLRWWISISEDGSNQWYFESAPQKTTISPIDRRVFWWGLYGGVIAWSFFAFASFLSLSFEWLIVDAIGLGLTGANLWGYLKCSSDASKRLSQTLTAGAVSGLRLVPGALPALGTTVMSILRTQATNSIANALAAGAATAMAPAATSASVSPVVVTAARAPGPSNARSSSAQSAFSGDVGTQLPGQHNEFEGTI